MLTRDRIFFGFYIVVLMLFMFGAKLYPDGYYYWNWSEHLQLSYFDGSPLIAYVIKIFTLVFGQYEWSIYLIGMTAAIISGWCVYQVSLLLFGQEVASLAFPLWLVTPGVIRYFFFQVSYNTMLITFWGLTCYTFVKLVKTAGTRYFYLCGVCIGFLLLSKYSGILLCCALFLLCLIYKKYRFVLLSPHFYAAMVLAYVIFSPVLVWNFQNHWVSFLFQLHHGYVGQETTLLSRLKHYFVGSLADYNVPLILLVILSVTNFKKIFQTDYALLTIPALFVFGFFALSACFAMPQTNWNAPFYFTGVILLAALLSQLRYKKILFYVTAIIAAAISCLLMLGNRSPAFYLLKGSGWSGVYAMASAMKYLDTSFYQHKLIFANDYQLLSFAHYFLLGHPEVYSMDEGSGHQYYLWWQERKKQPVPNDVLFLSLQPLQGTTVNQLQNCHEVSHQTVIQHRYFHGNYVWELYGYGCELR